MDLSGASFSRTTFWGGLAGLLCTYLAFGRLQSWYRLSHIKGPRVACWTDLWLIYKTQRGELFEELGQVCKQYGMRIPLADSTTGQN